MKRAPATKRTRPPNIRADPDSILIGIREAAALTNTSISTIRKWLKCVPPEFPAPIRLGPTGATQRWRRAAIEDFLSRREAAT